MIATDIEVVKATFAAFAARDLEAVLALGAPDVEFTAVTGEHAGRTEPYRGTTACASTSATWPPSGRSCASRRASSAPRATCILVTGRVSARSRSRTVTGSTGWIWRVRDGKVDLRARVRSAADAIAALEEGEGGPSDRPQAGRPA